MQNLPAHLQNRARRDLATAAMSGLNAGSPPHISIAGNRFTLVDAAGNEKPIQTLYLDVCIIDANPSVSRIYFDPAKPFVPGAENSDPPICWSDNGIGASAQASQPQSNDCQICPHAAWGSAQSKQTGRGIPACSSVKKLAVVIPNMGDMVFLLRIPPASLKHLAKYTQTVAGHGVDLPDAITRLEFESQGVLKFTPVGYVDEATAQITEKVWASKGTEMLVGKLDRPWTGQADAQKALYAAYAAQTQAGVLPPPAERAPPPLNQPAFGAPYTAPPAPFGGQQAPPQAPFGAVQPAPFGESAMTHGAFTAAPIAPAAAGQTAPARRPRGPNKPKAEPAAAANDGIPPFLQRNPAPMEPQTPPANTFGMQANPAAPDAGIAAALDAAFRLPT